MTSLPEHIKRVLDVACKPCPKREEILKLVVETIGESCCVLFWVYDREFRQYLLHDVLDHNLGATAGRDLSRSAVGCEPPSSGKPLSLEFASLFLARVKSTLDDEFQTFHSTVIPIFTKAEYVPIGLFQILTRSPVAAPLQELLHHIGDAAAAATIQWRERRELRALQDLQREVSLDKPITAWFKLSAKVLQGICEAKLCMLFTPHRNHSLTATACYPCGFSLANFVAGPSSILRSAFEARAGLRIADFGNVRERVDKLRVSTYDKELAAEVENVIGEPIRGLLATPIVTHNRVLGIVALFNKQGYLPAQFTETDARIAGATCAFLSGVIPSIQMAQTIEELSNVRSITNPDVGGGSELHQLFSPLSRMVPSLSSAVLGLRNWGGREINTIVLGGNYSLAADDFSPTDVPMPIPDRDAFRYCIELKGLANKSAFLLLFLDEKTLSEPERRTIRFLGEQIGHALRTDEIVETELRRLVETRHAIRSGLNGLGHLDEALTTFDLLRVSEDSNDREVLIERAHKAVKRARMFAEKTRILMDESRFLLTDVSPKSLQPTTFALPEVLQEVNLCLAPDAEDKDVTVDIVQRVIPSQEKVFNDRQLTEILVFNLLDNAIKYSLDNHHVTVRCFLRGSRWVLEFINNGPWIPLQDRAAIFLPFERRVSGNWSSETTGTGVGLAVVKKIVQAHGGAIDVTSEKLSERSSNARTVFAVSLPRFIKLEKEGDPHGE